MLNSNTSNSQRWKQFYDKLAPDYHKYRNRFKYFWNDTTKYFNYFMTENDTVLEVGCGIGDTLNQLHGKKKVGIDFSPKMIEAAKKTYPEIEFIQADATTINLEEKFDVVILSNMIGYVDDVQKLLVNLQSVCHSRTRIMVSYYNRTWQPFIRLAEIFGIKKKSPEPNWLSRHDIRNLLYLSGYDTYRQNTRILCPIFIPIISFILNKYIAKLPLLSQLCLAQYAFAKTSDISVSHIEKHYTVSVIVPARNESGNIEKAILDTPELGLGTELIFIEGNSTDDTWETIQKMYANYKDKRKLVIDRQDGIGKYDAVKKGFDIATGDILMILDADLTVPPSDLVKFYNAIVTNKGGFINGSRLVYPMESKAMRFLNMLGNKFFSYVFSWMLEQPVKDTLCGTKVMFKSDYLKLAQNRKYFGDFDPFGDFDLLFGAYKLNLKIIDLPIRYKERTYGDTNISRFKHGLILLKMSFFALNKIKFL